MKQVLGPISKIRSLIDLKFELKMYFCKICPNVKPNEATPIYSFHVYTLFDSFWGPEAKPFDGSGTNTKFLQHKIHLHAKFELNRIKIVDARARHPNIHTHTERKTLAKL